MAAHYIKNFRKNKGNYYCENGGADQAFPRFGGADNWRKLVSANQSSNSVSPYVGKLYDKDEHQKRPDAEFYADTQHEGA